MKYTTITNQESMEIHGPFGIEINISAGRELSQDETFEVSQMAGKIREFIMEKTIREYPKEIARAAKEREDILALFPAPIYVEEIPNGYCSSYCCKHLPWFVITTSIGRIKIGWRKRVINIDWTQTTVKECGILLFPGDEVTRSGKYDTERYIHAYGYEKAKEYIHTLINQQ